MVEPPGTAKAKEGLGKAVGGIRTFARNTSAHLIEQAGDLKDTALDTVETMAAKEPDPYEQAIADYNAAYTAMNDTGLSILRQRERSADVIEIVEALVNSIANTPKSFERDFIEIDIHKARFIEAEEFARRDLDAARKSARNVGAGLAAGAAVASIAPTAAIWVATTFGTASTGTAISVLSGVAASNAALAWLGGGAIVAGGGGMVAGSALLALAGPVGWTLAGATLLTSIALFTKKKFENRQAKHDALTALMKNTSIVEGIDARITDLLERTASLRELLIKSYSEALECFGADFATLSTSQQTQLAALVNNTKACAALLSRRLE